MIDIFTRRGNMIPNTLSSRGAYADLWCDLKSMDYALERCMDHNLQKLEDLDKDRLKALVNFLRNNLLQPSDDDIIPTDLTDLHSLSQHSTLSFEPDIDLKNKIQKIPELISWPRGSKKGPKAKIHLLINSIDSFVNDSAKPFLEISVPRKEFEIIRKILAVLLKETQSEL